MYQHEEGVYSIQSEVEPFRMSIVGSVLEQKPESLIMERIGTKMGTEPSGFRIVVVGFKLEQIAVGFLGERIVSFRMPAVTCGSRKL